MSRFTFAVNKTHDPATFINAGGGQDIGLLQVSVDQNTTNLNTNYVQLATDLSATITAYGTLLPPGPDPYSIFPLVSDTDNLADGIANLGVLATQMSAPLSADVAVSVNVSNIPSVSRLKQAFDAIIKLAQGGAGGFTP